MPNRVAELRAEIEAAHPGAVMRHRGEAGFGMRLPSGVEEHRYSTGPWHWRQSDADEWAEIDTDLEARPDTVWRHGVRSARFDTLLADDGRRRFVPRRWLPGEFVEFGRLEWQRPSGVWAPLPVGVMSRQGNLLCGADHRDGRLEVGFHGRGSRTSLTLKRGTWARPLRWSVTLNGLAWQDGALISESDGERVGFIRPPAWTDAAEGSMPHPIPWDYDGGHVILTPDLTGARFPVEIDPDYSIAANADDGYVYTNSGTFNSNSASIYGGKQTTTNVACTWLRFNGIAATSGANCSVAHLHLMTNGGTAAGAVKTAIWLIDEDTSAAPTNYNPTWLADHALHDGETKTDWDFTSSDGYGESQTTVDFAAHVTHILARAGWGTGGALQVHIDDDGSANTTYQAWASRENTSYAEPVLSLTIQTATTLVGAVTATAAVEGSLKINHRLQTATAASAAIQGGLNIAHQLTGAVQAAAAVAGGLGIMSDQTLVGAVQAQAALAADLDVTRQLNGAISSSPATAGTLTIGHQLAGTVTAAATIQGALQAGHDLTGTVTAATTITGAVKTNHQLAGAVTATASVAGRVGVEHDVGGVIIMPDSAVTGDLDVTRQLAGAAAAIVAVAGDLRIVHQLVGAAAATVQAAGDLKLEHDLNGAITAGAVAAGFVNITRQLQGTIQTLSLLTGNLIKANPGRVGTVTLADRLAGTVAAAEALAGTAVPTEALAASVTAAETGAP